MVFEHPGSRTKMIAREEQRIFSLSAFKVFHTWLEKLRPRYYGRVRNVKYRTSIAIDIMKILGLLEVSILEAK